MKRSTQLAVTVLVVTLLLLPFVAPAVTGPDVLAEVRDHWMFALKLGDPVKLAAVFAESATIMPPGFPSVTGRKAIESFYRDGFAVFGVREAELHPKERQTGSKSVREHGTYKITIVPKNDDPPYTVMGRYLFIGAKRPDGKWEIVWEIHTIESKVPLDQL
jgi:ketosteroid isomerase-like protein